MSLNNELNHHGIQGQKWGKRRFQNPDGTLTAEGKVRYSKKDEVRFRDQTFSKKAARTVTAASTLGLAKPVSRLISNHKMGSKIVLGSAAAGTAAVGALLLGPELGLSIGATAAYTLASAGANAVGAVIGVENVHGTYKNLYRSND